MLYVGADGHKDFVTLSIMTSTGRVKETFELPATPEGMDQLVEKMGDPKRRVRRKRIPLGSAENDALWEPRPQTRYDRGTSAPGKNSSDI